MSAMAMPTHRGPANQRDRPRGVMSLSRGNSCLRDWQPVWLCPSLPALHGSSFLPPSQTHVDPLLFRMSIMSPQQPICKSTIRRLLLLSPWSSSLNRSRFLRHQLEHNPYDIRTSLNQGLQVQPQSGHFYDLQPLQVSCQNHSVQEW